MKRAIPIFIVLIIAMSNLVAQDANWEFTLAPELAFPYYTNHGAAQKATIGGSSGIGLTMKLAEKIELYNEIRYTLSGFKIKHRPLKLNSVPGGVSIGRSDEVEHIRYLDQHLSVIASGRFYYKTGKTSIFQTVGLQPNYFFKSTATKKSSDPDADRTWDEDGSVSKSYFFVNGRIGLGFKHDLSKKLYLSATPEFRGGFWIPYEKSSLDPIPPMALELNLSLGFKL